MNETTNILDENYNTINSLRAQVKRLQAEVRAYRDRLAWAEIGAAENSSDEARATTIRTIQDHIDARAAVDTHRDLD